MQEKKEHDSEMFETKLITSLVHPRQQLLAFNRKAPYLSFERLPYRVWSWLVLIAVGGSLIYGASLSLKLTSFRPETGALWLALSAGLSWCIFGPLLIAVSRLNKFICAHACLVTMAYGEIVLVTGALINLSFSLLNIAIAAELFNWGWVALSNLVMATSLAAQLSSLQVAAWKTVAVWLLGLNGSGLLLFWLFGQILF